MKNLLFVLAVALAGCENGPPHDVEFYKAHAAERIDMLTQCANDPGHIGLTVNCVNAREAAKQLVFSVKNSRHISGL